MSTAPVTAPATAAPMRPRMATKRIPGLIVAAPRATESIANPMRAIARPQATALAPIQVAAFDSGSRSRKTRHWR